MSLQKRSWTNKDLRSAVKNSKSVRMVIQKLGLVPAGGNYVQVKDAIHKQGIAIEHFTGKGWRKGMSVPTVPAISLKKLLVKNSSFQSHKLKKRLFREGIKKSRCEICGWAEKREDGTIPVELDHINGDRRDNRLRNIRILCPNCHSLQDTHRGRNIGKMPG